MMMRRIRKYFFSGLAVFLPLVLTIYVCIWFLNFAESIIGKYLKPFLLDNYDFYFWGLGIAVLVLIILFFGFLITNYFGRAAHRMTEKIMLQIPIMSSIYPAFKEIAGFIFKEEENADNPQQVVMIQWPRPGVYTIGFLTNKTPKVIADQAGGKDMVNVLIPTVPNPLTGFIAILPRENVTPLAMTVEDAIKIIVSGGVVDPHYKVATEEPRAV